MRQGDPLSPFLFNLVVDVLRKLFEKAKEASIFEGLVLGKKKVVVSHLQFAYDTIFFLKPEMENLGWLSKIIQLFSSMLGLRVNLEKSSLLGINVDIQRVQAMADAIGCKAEEWPIKYLGIPLGEENERFSLGRF